MNADKIDNLRKDVVLMFKEMGYLCDDMKFFSTSYAYSNIIDILVNDDYVIQCHVIECINGYGIYSRIIADGEIIKDLYFYICVQ